MPSRVSARAESEGRRAVHVKKRRDHFKAMQTRFIEAWHELPSTLSKTERARQAAIKAGYSVDSARAAGTKMLAKPHILEALLGSHPRTRAERAGIDAVWVLNELADLWDCPLEELFDERGSLRDIRDMPHLVQKLIAGFEIEERVVEANGRRRVTSRTGKIKLIDRIGILDKIGKNYLVSAYVSPETREAEKSFAELLRAKSKAFADSVSEIDITPQKPSLATETRRLADVLGAQDE